MIRLGLALVAAATCRAPRDQAVRARMQVVLAHATHAARARQLHATDRPAPDRPAGPADELR